MVAANGSTLRELRTDLRCPASDFHVAEGSVSLPALLRAAPALRVLSASAECSVDEAPALLRNEPPYGPLQMHTLAVDTMPAHGAEAPLLALAAALPAHTALRSLKLTGARTENDAAFGTLVDSALLRGCHPSSCPCVASLRLRWRACCVAARLQVCASGFATTCWTRSPRLRH